MARAYRFTVPVPTSRLGVMGGHGGLNILPQKSWHLYRDDNRLRVRRDERRNREEVAGAEASRQRSAFNDRLDVLRSRRLGLGEVEGEHVSVPAGADTDSGQVTESTEAVEENQKVVVENSGGNRSRENTVPAVSSGHFNLFEDLEKEELRRRVAHEKYLEEVGHDKKRQSEFDVCNQSKQRVPWYLKKELPTERIIRQHRAEQRCLTMPTANGNSGTDMTVPSAAAAVVVQQSRQAPIDKTVCREKRKRGHSSASSSSASSSSSSASSSSSSSSASSSEDSRRCSRSGRRRDRSDMRHCSRSRRSSRRKSAFISRSRSRSTDVLRRQKVYREHKRRRKEHISTRTSSRDNSFPSSRIESESSSRECNPNEDQRYAALRADRLKREANERNRFSKSSIKY